MTTYTSKPVQVDAVRWDAPVDDSSDGNLNDLNDLAGGIVRKQAPWNPSEGQNCALLVYPATAVSHDPVTGEPTGWSEPDVQVIKPGDYLVKDESGVFVMDGGKFTNIYDASADTARDLTAVEAAGNAAADALDVVNSAAAGATDTDPTSQA
jgi:hypothetical protein